MGIILIQKGYPRLQNCKCSQIGGLQYSACILEILPSIGYFNQADDAIFTFAFQIMRMMPYLPFLSPTNSACAALPYPGLDCQSIIMHSKDLFGFTTAGWQCNDLIWTACIRISTAHGIVQIQWGQLPRTLAALGTKSIESLY